jgi:hypothetical protein
MIYFSIEERDLVYSSPPDSFAGFFLLLLAGSLHEMGLVVL